MSQDLDQSMEHLKIYPQGYELEMDLYRVKKKTSAPAIIIMPGGSEKNYRKPDRKNFQGLNQLAEELFREGFASIVFNGRGQGSVAGAWSYSNFEEDLKAVVDYLKSQNFVNTNRIGVWARGTAVAARYSINHPKEIKSVVLWACPPSTGMYWLGEYAAKYWGPTFVKALEANQDYFKIRGTTYDLKKLKEDIEAKKYDLEILLGEINFPILIAGGSEDLLDFHPHYQIETLTLGKLKRTSKLRLVILPYCERPMENDHPQWDNFVNLFIAWFNETLK